VELTKRWDASEGFKLVLHVESLILELKGDPSQRWATLSPQSVELVDEFVWVCDITLEAHLPTHSDMKSLKQNPYSASWYSSAHPSISTFLP
jgi:hypothetical protein